MMTITLLNNLSEANRIGKDKTVVSTVQGTLREESSILNPVIIVELETLPAFNYIWVEEFNRYYFVNDVTSFRNNLWKISAHVDVLETYITDILNLTVLVSRQSGTYDLLYDDDELHFRNNNIFGMHALESVTPAFTNGSYFMISVGKKADIT